MTFLYLYIGIMYIVTYNLSFLSKSLPFHHFHTRLAFTSYNILHILFKHKIIFMFMPKNIPPHIAYENIY